MHYIPGTIFLMLLFGWTVYKCLSGFFVAADRYDRYKRERQRTTEQWKVRRLARFQAPLRGRVPEAPSELSRVRNGDSTLHE